MYGCLRLIQTYIFNRGRAFQQRSLPRNGSINDITGLAPPSTRCLVSISIFGVAVLLRLVARPPSLHHRPVIKIEGEIKHYDENLN